MLFGRNLLIAFSSPHLPYDFRSVVELPSMKLGDREMHHFIAYASFLSNVKYNTEFDIYSSIDEAK